MKCPNCNETDHEPSAKFCHRCGAKLTNSGKTINEVKTFKDNLQPVRTYYANGVPFNMVLVEGGSFWMGAQDENPGNPNYVSMPIRCEKPVHRVTLDSFYIGETVVTQSLWKAVMGTDIYTYVKNRSFLFGVGNNYPMYYLSWNDCQDFISKLRHMIGDEFRLLTEAEWEFAARGGNKSKGYLYAGSNNVDDVAWYIHNVAWYVQHQTSHMHHEVKRKMPNELGLYDMSGNVGEWCFDWYGDYGYEPQVNPVGEHNNSQRVRQTDGSYCREKVLRGSPISQHWCTVFWRDCNIPVLRGDSYGLRLGLSCK